MDLSFDEVNERVDKVKSSWQKRQPSKAPNVKQKGKNPYRYANEDKYEKDLDEEDHVPHINLSRFGWGNENREVRYEKRSWSFL